MVLIQWLERGLGQYLAPDPNYKEDPDAIDTQSIFWKIVAPDPNFVDVVAVDEAATGAKSVSFRSPSEKRKPQESTSVGAVLCSRCSKEIDPQFTTPPQPTKQRLAHSEPAKKLFSPRPQQATTLHHTDRLIQHVFQASCGVAEAGQSQSHLYRKFFAGLASGHVQSMKKALQKDPHLMYARGTGDRADCLAGYTPLMITVSKKSVAASHTVWEYVLKNATTTNPLDYLALTDILGRNVFHVAAQKGNDEITQWLYSLVPLPEYQYITAAQDVNGHTPLAVALLSPFGKARKAARVNVHDPAIQGTPLPAQERVLRIANLTVGLAEVPGLRVRNEDYTVVGSTDDDESKTVFIAVADGHGDHGAIAKLVAEGWVESMRDLQGLPSPPLSWWELKATDICLGLDDHVRRNKQQYKGGAVANLCAITPTQVVVVNVGDCRCLLIAKKAKDELVEATEQLSLDDNDAKRGVLMQEVDVIALSTDHKVNVKEEADRAVAAGFSICQDTFVNDAGETETIHKIELGGETVDRVAFSRSFGDFDYKTRTDLDPAAQAVIAVPEVRIRERSPLDLFLVVACDGIWDIYSNDKVAEFVMEGYNAGMDPASIADGLLQACLNDKAKDNLSVVIVALTDTPLASATPKKSLFADESEKYEL